MKKEATKKKSLLASFRTLFIISISISSLVMAIVFSTIYNQHLAQNNMTNISNTLSSLGTSMDIYISELNSIANVPYYDNNVFQTMEEINQSKSINDDLSINEMPAGRNYRIAFLKYMYNSSQVIDGITFFPENNPAHASYSLNRNIAKTNIATNDPYQDSIWYQRLSKNPLLPVFSPEYDENGALAILSYSKSIRDIDTKKVIGYLKISSSSNSYIDLMKAIDVGAYSALCLSTEDNDIIYIHTRNSALNSCTSLDDLISSISGHPQTLKALVPGTSLTLTYIISDRELLGSQLLTYLVVLLIIFISTIIAFLLYQHQAKKLTATITKIQDSLSYVAAGNLAPIHISARESELEDIILSINHMIEKLNEYITKEYKANLMQQEAEYRALQAQINPHFLYNTLNGFIGLNRMGEKKLLESSIINLTQLFQYTCNPATTVTLESEIQFIRQYLTLQSLKYDDRLSFEISLDETTRSIEIPKLLLQPMVENSIIHGLEPTDSPIVIQIHSIPVNGYFGSYIAIILQDNGVGFSISELSTKERIGLNNIQKRLKYSNKDNVFQILSKPGGGTTCILLIRESTR